MMNEINQLIIPLAGGIFLDALFGDARWIPHPIKFFGKTISYMEHCYNSAPYQKFKGSLVTVFLIIMAGILAKGIILVSTIVPIINYSIASLLVFLGIANRSLITESLNVQKKLKQEGLTAGSVARIYIMVKRLINRTLECGIERSLIETFMLQSLLI